MSLALTDTALAGAMRDCFVANAGERTAAELVMPSEPPDFGDVPDKVIVILFASRSGSSYAGQLLENTPYFNIFNESFNAEQLAMIREKHGLADSGAALKWMIANRGTRHAFGVKCGWPGLFSAWHLGFLDACLERTQFLLLKRRDRVAQAVSLFRAQISGRFHSPQTAEREVDIGDYDRERIATSLELIDRAYVSLGCFLDRIGKPYRRMYYEDICAQPEAFVGDVCADLGLAAPEHFRGKVRVAVLRDEINAEWVERFHRGD